MIHKDLAKGGWFTMSLLEQMGNIGSEIHRLVLSQKHDPDRFDSTLDKALELIDLTLADHRWKKRYKEIARVREVLCDLCFGQNQYNTSLESLDDYFFWFGVAAQSRSIAK